MAKCVDLDLQNDFKKLMKEIEEGIHRVHQEAREKKPDPQIEQKQAVSYEKGDDIHFGSRLLIISAPSRILKYLLQNY